MSSVLRQEAEESISSGQWDEAIEKLEQLRASEEWTLDLYPELARANAVRGRFLTVLSVYLEWADNAVEAADFEQAEKALEYAQSLRPDSPDVQEMAVRIARHNVSLEILADRLVELAHLHLEKGDGDRAVALVEEAIQARPEDHSLKLQLGETFVANGQIKSGLKIFEQYVEEHSDCGEPAKLKEPLQRINLLQPDNKETMLHLGRVYLALDEVDKAEDQFRAVLKQDLENQDALLELARVCQKKGLFRNGLLALNRVILKNPELPSAHRQMAEIHLAAGSPEKAVGGFLEAARLYAESGEGSTVVELYRTVLRVDSDNSKALNALHSIGLQKGEDLTINLFPPMEETSTAPGEEETRPHPVNPQAIETGEGFTEMNLVEEAQEEKTESKASDFLPTRPALVPKSGLVKAGGGKPTYGSPRSGRPLREGLVSRGSTGKGTFIRGATQKSDKPFFVREEPAAKAEVPQTVEPEAIVEPAVLPPLQPETADPIVENLTPVEIEPEPAPEVAVGPVSPGPEAPPIEDEFGFESIFEGVDSLFEDPALSSGAEKPLDIPAFTEVFEEPAPEPVADVDVPEDVPEDSIFDFNFDMEEETKPFVLFESEAEIDEPVDSGSEHIEDPMVREESDELITTVEDESEIVAVDESLIDVPVDAGVLFPTDEPLDSIFDFDKEWMEPTSEEAAEPEESHEVEQLPVAEAVVEEIDELDSSWLFPPEEISNPVQSPADEVALVEPAAESATPEPSLVECKVDNEIEDPMPTFEWELDFETPEEPEASPLFPEVAEPVEADDSLEYERLRAVEISKLAREDELTVETPELIRILEDTLPQTVQAEVIEEEDQEPEALVEEAIDIVDEPVVSEFEIPEEAADVATRIESFRQRLVISPTDESAALALADTCLRYGLLEEALQHYRRVQKANPSCLETSSRIIKAALWMEDVPTVKAELWKAARLSFDLGDLKACQDRLGDLLSLDREHKEARQLMVEVFLVGGQEKLAAWHLSQMVERAIGEEEYDLAIHSLKRLNDISPSDAALERLGELYQKQHRLDEALEIFRTLRSAHLSRDELQDAVRLARQVVDLESQRTDDREVLIELLSQNGSNSEVVEEQLELAKLYRQNDQTQQAVELLQTLLQEDPSHLDAERLLVELHLQTGSLDLAEQHAESLAERFLEKKAYQKAINLFEYWVGAAPASARARERLAQFYQLNGDLDGAKMEWLMVTESHQAGGDFQRAARSLERALELDPQQVEWRLRLAQLKAQELGQVESALQDLRLLFQADPSWRKATVCYLDLLMEQSRMAELGEALQAVEHLTPGSGLKDNVVRSVKEKMTREPDNLELAFGWGELCLALGLLDLAIEQFQRLRRHERYQLHSYRLLGLCFSQKKGFNMVELALSQFKRGLALEGQTPEDRLELQYARACVLSDHGRNDEAVEQLQQIAAEDPNYRDVAKRLEQLG